MSANNIQVAIKVRPILKKEKDKTLNSLWKIVQNSIHQVDGTSEFFFDHIFDQHVNNTEVFDKMAKPIVDSALKGINGTIFAYGQTASGKTYTMLGDDKNPGVMVLTAREIFKEIEEARDREFLLRVGYIEIYNEKIFDLLTKNEQDLKIHETSNGDVNVNCKEFIITSQDEMMQYLILGSKLRRCGETGMNERSSRSHAIFRIIIESRELNKTREDGSVQISILNLVDLAGSERADQTGATGCRLKEGSHINRSLLFLSCVIKQLSENEEKFINYRDSKLTRILQASLGGNALTAIICTITPTAFEETQSTLKFAMRAKKIKNKPQVNEVLTDSAMMKMLEKEITRLKSALEIEKTKNSKLKVTQLERQINEENLKIICSHSAVISKTNPSHQRRRTWCPSYHDSTNIVNPPKINVQHLENERNVSPNLLPDGLTRSQISQNKFLTPLIGVSGNYMENNYYDDFHLDINDEFISAENIVFPTSPNNTIIENLRRTPPNVGGKQPVIITPKHTIEDDYKKLKEQFEELEAYTNLEKNLKVERDDFDKVRQQLAESQAKILKYEQEALNATVLKEKLSEIEINFTASEDRSRLYEKEMIKYKDEIELAKSKFNEQTSHLNDLQKKVRELEVENREYISLEFEFQQVKNKSKLREGELLDVLKEKDTKLLKLENSIKLLSIRDNQNDSNEITKDSICIKCGDLERIISENNTLQTSVTVLKEDVESKQIEIEKLIAENQQLLKDNETYKQEELSLKKDVDDQLDQNKIYLEELNRLKTDQDDFNLEKESNAIQLKNILQEKEFCQQELHQLKIKFDCLQSDRNKLQLEYDEVSKDCANLRVECDEVRQMFSKHKSERKILTEELDSLNEKISILNMASEKLKLDKEESDNTMALEIKSARSDLAKTQIEILDLQSKHEFTISEYKQLKSKFDELQIEIDKTILEKQELQSKYDLLQSNFNQLEESQNSLETISEGPNKISINGHTFDNDKENFSKLLNNLDKLENDNKLLSQNKIFIESEIEKLAIELRNVKSELHELKDEHKSLQLEYDNVSEEIMDHIQENENLLSQVNQLKIEIQENYQKLKSCNYSGLNVIQENSEEELINCLKGEIDTLKALNKTLEEEIQASNVNVEVLKTKIHEHEKNENDLNNIVSSVTNSPEKIIYNNVLNNELDASRKTNGHTDTSTNIISDRKTEIKNVEVETLNNVKIKNIKTEIQCYEYEMDMSIDIKSVKNDDIKPKDILKPSENDISNKVQIFECENINLKKIVEKLTIETKNLMEKFKDIEFENDQIKENNVLLGIENSSLLQKLELVTKDLNKISENQQQLLENNDLKKQSDTLSSELVCLNESSNKEINSLLDKINSLITENDQLKQVNQNLSEQLQHLSSQIQTPESVKINCTENDQPQLNLSKDNMSEKLDGNEKESSLLMRLNNLDEENIKLKANNEQLLIKLNSFAEENKKYVNLNDITNELQLKLNNKLNDLDKLKVKCELLEKQTGKDSIEIAALKEFKTTSSIEIIQLKDNIEELILKCKRLESQCNIQLNEYNELLSKCELEEAKNIELKTIKNNGDNMTFISQVEEECKELKTSISTLGYRIYNLEQERIELLEEKKQLLSKIENITIEVLEDGKAQQNKILLLEKEREQFLKEKQFLQTNASAVVDLKNEINTIVEQKQERETKVETLQILQNENEKLLRENEELKINATIKLALENERDQLLEQKQELELKVKSIEIEHDELNRNYSDLQTKNTTSILKLENERDNLLEKTRELEIKCKTLEILEKERSNLLQENEELKQKASIIETLESERDQFLKQAQEFETMIKEVAFLENDREQLKQKVLQSNIKTMNILQKERDQLLEELQHKTTSIVRLENERDQLLKQKQEFETITQSVVTLKNEREKLKQKNLELQSDVKTLNILQKESDQLLKELQKKTTSIVRLESERDQLLKQKQEFETITQSVVTLENEREKLKQKNLELQSDVKTLNILQKESDQLLEENRSLQLEIQNNQENIDQIKKEYCLINTDLKNEIKQMEHIRDTLLNENKVLETSVNKKAEEIRQIRQERDQLSIENKKLIVDIENILILKNRIQELAEKDVEKINVEKKSLSDQLLSLKTTSDAASEALKSKYNMLVEKTSQLNDEIQRLKVEILRAQSLVDQKTTEMDKIKETAESEVKNLQSQIESVTSLFMAEKKILCENVGATEKYLRDQIQKLETEIVTLKNKKITTINIKTNSISPKREGNLENLIGESNQLKIKNMSLEDKLEASHKTSQKDRKSRRLSSHDEGRKSLIWDNTQEAQTMTDPTDSSCNCAVLDQKVNDLKRKLLIRESQINTLCLEMKTHSMKDENERLKKLLSSEDEIQRQLRKEIKTLKQIIIDKVNENKICSMCTANSKRIFCDSFTQTGSELMPQLEISEKDIIESDVYKKLIGKNELLKSICRNRYARLTELEQQLNCKENNTRNKFEDTTSKHTIEQKYEKLLRDFKIISGKYEEAKIVCLSRAEEISQLKEASKSIK